MYVWATISARCGSETANSILVIEMFLTAELVFTIFMLAAEKHKGTFIAPIGIGLALFIAELAGVFYTGGMSILSMLKHRRVSPHDLTSDRNLIQAL